MTGGGGGVGPLQLTRRLSDTWAEKNALPLWKKNNNNKKSFDFIFMQTDAGKAMVVVSLQTAQPHGMVPNCWSSVAPRVRYLEI